MSLELCNPLYPRSLYISWQVMFGSEDLLEEETDDICSIKKILKSIIPNWTSHDGTFQAIKFNNSL